MGRSAASPHFAAADYERAARVMVIAEIGVNHDGNTAKAEELIRGAAEAGADAVKFQLFQPERLLSNQARLAAYQDGKADDAKSLLADLTLSPEQLWPLRETARSLKLKFVVTPFSPADANDLRMLDVDLIKIASPDAVNPPLLDAASKLDKPMLISTGTCELDELDTAGRHAQRVTSAGPGALLQCVSAYPTPDESAGLGGMAALQECFPGCAVGYSDHTAALDTGALAMAAGAVVIEKHLTHDRTAAGPDHAASLEPAQLRTYVKQIRRAAAMLGPIQKTCTDRERDVQAVSRQSVCAAHDLPAGRRLNPDDLTVMRPGTGIPAARFDAVVGRVLACDVPRGQLLQPGDLTDS